MALRLGRVLSSEGNAACRAEERKVGPWVKKRGRERQLLDWATSIPMRRDERASSPEARPGAYCAAPKAVAAVKSGNVQWHGGGDSVSVRHV